MMKKCKQNHDEKRVIDNKIKPEFTEVLNILPVDKISLEINSEDSNKENVSSNIHNNSKKCTINTSANRPKESIFTSLMPQKLDRKELNDLSSQPKSSLKLQNVRKFVPKNRPATIFTEFKIEYAISNEASI